MLIEAAAAEEWRKAIAGTSGEDSTAEETEEDSSGDVEEGGPSTGD